MITKILSLLAGLFDVIKLIGKWIKPRTPSKKIEKEKKKSRDDVDEFEKEGRPKW